MFAKKIILAVLFLNLALSCAARTFERGVFERSRFNIENRKIGADIRRANVKEYDKVKRFRLPEDAELSMKLSALKVRYPKAYANMDSIDDFSHFGFLICEVRAGRYPLEKFLKEYEAYLKYFN